MATSQSDKVITVADGEMPFSDPTEATPSQQNSLDAIPPAQTSAAVSGIQAVTAATAGPNVLVATDGTGKLPTTLLPAGATYLGPTTQTAYNSTSRAFGTVYHNTGTTPILVLFTCNARFGTYVVAYCDSSASPTTEIGRAGSPGGNYSSTYGPISFFVLPNYYYKITNAGTSWYSWIEWK